MKVLLAASEVAPLIKLGGLGDVIGSLPKALEKLNVNVDVIVPFFPFAKVTDLKLYKSIELTVPFDNATHTVEVFKTKLPSSQVDVLLLRNAKYFGVSKVNPIPSKVSELELFTFFSKAVVEYIKAEFSTYNLIHCNDWHTGLITDFLQEEFGETRPKTLFTIHNLLYQGVAGLEIVREAGIVPGENPIIDFDIADGTLNMMMQGIASTDYVNTVSPSYAKEILSEEFGKNLYDTLKAREDRLMGILNGVDYSQFPRFNDVQDSLTYKKAQKQKLQKELGLKQSDAPLFCFISRLDPNQKGLDLLLDAILHILQQGGQFVLLGLGDKAWEEKFKNLETAGTKGNLAINISFDTGFANRIYEGSDFVVIPSKYEPCGLNQMIGMWYGAVPIVHAVGGLKDSINDGVNGFTFEKYDAGELITAIDRALKVFYSDHRKLLLDNALRADFSWDKSAKLYKNLYEQIYIR